jgi:multidrug resistance efflux pump
VIATCFLAWYIAGHWDSWTGSARHQWIDDAYITGDVTALAAKISGYVASYQSPSTTIRSCTRAI